MTSIDAVIVRWRNGDELRRCLRSLIDHGGDRLRRIILVDSGSGDGGEERLLREFQAIETIALEENLGFAHAANRGAAAADNPMLLVLNPDTEVHPQAIDTLAATLDQNPAAAGAVPLLQSSDGGSQYRWQLCDLPTPFRLARGLGGQPAFSAPPRSVTTVAQPAAAAWLVHRRAWDDMGGFDEEFTPAWWEDVDFCQRLDDRLPDPRFPFERGFIVSPHADFVHVGGSSTHALGDAAFLAAYHRNLLVFAAKHFPDQLATIRNGLRLTLLGKMLLRPRRRRSYRAALEAIRVTR